VIKVALAEWCATVEADHFGALGAYDTGFADEVAAIVIELSDDDHVKTIVLKSRGHDFAPRVPASPPPAGLIPTTWHRSFAASSAVYQALCFSKKVVITVVTGECSAAGTNLVLCSDLTVADATATFASPFLDTPEANFVLAALTVRLNRAKAWMLRNSVIPAAEALSIGLINQVVPADRVLDAAREISQAVAGMPLDGVTMSKMLQQAVYDAHGIGREFDMADHYAIHRWVASELEDKATR
jgi:enoyl-CoA hydratase/carnithine racemase